MSLINKHCLQYIPLWSKTMLFINQTVVQFSYFSNSVDLNNIGFKSPLWTDTSCLYTPQFLQPCSMQASWVSFLFLFHLLEAFSSLSWLKGGCLLKKEGMEKVMAFKDEILIVDDWTQAPLLPLKSKQSCPLHGDWSCFHLGAVILFQECLPSAA